MTGLSPREETMEQVLVAGLFWLGGIIFGSASVEIC